MAIFLPVAPAHILNGIHRNVEDSKLLPNLSGNMRSFFLAHDVAAFPEKYSEDNLKHSFSIMDNSVVETGGSVDFKIVKKACKVVKPNVVVLPDVLEYGFGTICATLDAYPLWKEHFGNYYDPKMDKSYLMFVPQGETLEDWITCLETVMNSLKDDPPRWIGIPRNATDRIVPSRKILVDIVRILYPNAKIHLLGFSNHMYDDVISARDPAVYSIDSAVPIRIANYGQKFTLSCNPGKRGDWWEDGEFNIIALDNYRIITNLVHAGN